MEKAVPIKFGKKNFVGQREGNLSSFYETKEEIGKGGFGKVYNVRNRTTDEICVCKVIQKKDVKEKIKFEREIEILREADHPNIIKLYDVFQDERYFYIVMEKCKGGELSNCIIKKVQDRTLSYGEDDVKEIFLQIMRAVHYCHSNNICHRDLKLENVLLLTEEKNSPVKVIDFGLGQYTKKNKLREFCGTPYYIAPEVINKNYDQRCDIWSCGVILYVLLSGQFPFESNSESDLFKKILKAEYSFDSSSWKKISSDAKNLIRKMICPQAERFTAKQVLNHPWFSKRKLDNKLEFDTKIFKKHINKGIFNKMIRMHLATRLTDAEIGDAKNFFIEMDKDNNGTIEYNELKDFFSKLGEKLPENDEKELDQIFASLDTDKSGKIDYTEFLAGTLTMKMIKREDKILEAFKRFDRDGSGKIDKQDLIKILDEQGKSGINVDEIIEEADKNCDGEIDYNEFVNSLDLQP